jgi:hypothetical protein
MDTNIAITDNATPANTPTNQPQDFVFPRFERSDSVVTQACKLDLLERDFQGLPPLEEDFSSMEQMPQDLVDNWANDDCPDDCECHRHQGTQTDKVSKHVCCPKKANFTFKFSPRGIVTSMNCAKGGHDCQQVQEHTGTNEAVNEAAADVMTFADDVEVTTNSMDHKSTDVEMDFDERVDPSIEGILARPQFMTEYSWAETAADNSFPIMEFPEHFLKTSDIARAKLADYKYLRCDFKFRFTVNTSKFASGRLFFYVVPLRSLAGGRNSREDNLDDYTMATAYRGVELDLGSSDTCELEVPFVAPHSAIDLTRFDYSLFELRAIPFTDLWVDGDSASKLSINVYASIHNVQLAIPTTQPFAGRYMPDNASFVTDRVANLGRMSLKNNLYGVSAGTVFTPYGEQTVTHQDFLFTTAAGVQRVVSVPLVDISNIFNYPNTFIMNGTGTPSLRVNEHTGVEAEQQSTGVVSGVMDKVSRAAGVFTDVPFIGSYARTVSWAAELLGGAAKVFGFSKPTSVAAVTPCTIIPAKNFTNTDGIDNSIILGSSVNNSISGHDRFGCKEDEMAIPYLVSRSQLVDKAQWTPEDERGDEQLAIIPVNPTKCRRVQAPEYNNDNSMNDVTGKKNFVTIAGYVASMFKWWRGSIRYRISLSKTSFHSGRLRITWHPHQNDPASKFESTSSHTRIYDIRESNEIEFEVPYHANQPFRRVSFYDDVRKQGSNGYISIQVENRLVCPAQVNQTVDILIFQCMSPEDTAFHTPTFNLGMPGDLAPTSWNGSALRTIAEQSGVTAKLCENINCNRVVEHSGIHGAGLAKQQRSDNTIMTHDVIAPSRRTPVHAPGLLVGGECVRSVRALSRRFGLATVFKRNKGSDENFIMDTINYDTCPLSYDADDIDDTGSGGTNGTQGRCNATRYGAAIVSPLSYISRMYRLYAGGRRYKVDSGLLSSDSVTTSETYLASGGASFEPTDDSTVKTANSQPEAKWHRGAGTFRHVTSNHTNQFHEVEVPYQQTTSVAPLVNGYPLHERERPVIHFEVKGPDNGTANVPVYEAAADDHSFGLLISPPYLYDKGDSIPRRVLNNDWVGPKSAMNGFTIEDVIGKPFTYLSFDWTISGVDSQRGEITAYRNDAGQMISETFTTWSLIDARRNGQLASTQLSLDALLSVW